MRPERPGAAGEDGTHSPALGRWQISSSVSSLQQLPSGAGASAAVVASAIQGARPGPGWLWAPSPPPLSHGSSHGRHSKQIYLTILIPVTDLKAGVGPVPQRTARLRHRGSILTLRPRYVWTPPGLAWFRASPGQRGQACTRCLAVWL